MSEIKREAYLWRLKRSDHGTEGIFFTGGFFCMTLELPWHDNIRQYSCIPKGQYVCRKRYSPGRKYHTYHVTNVEGRSYILIHSGNYAGDTRKGFKSHVYGCILFGKKHGYLSSQRAVLNSRITIRAFERHMQWEPFKLNIVENFR